MPAKPVRPLNIFIGCPGDMAVERAELLKLRDHLDELGCPVRFLTWKNATPGAGNPQRVIFDNYPIVGWDVFVGLLWTRFGIASGIKDPLSGEILTGTEAEFAGAYDAFVASSGKRPQVLLYRCTRDLPVDVDIEQLAGVRQFFKQTASGAQRPALTQDFKTAEELKQRVTQDIVKVAERMRKMAKKPAISGTKAAATGRKEPDWAVAEENYRQHLIDSHRIVKFHTAEARAPVEVELEKVFIKLMAQARPNTWNNDKVDVVYEVARYFDTGLSGPLSDDQMRSLTTLRNTLVHAGHVGDDSIERTIEHVRRASLLHDLGHSALSASVPPTSLPNLFREQNHLALAGSPGSGKSTLLQYLVLTFASRQQEARLQLKEELLPVLIRLRQFHRWIEGLRHEKKLGELKPAHFQEFLAHQWAEEKGAPELPAGFFKRLLHDGRALILLDGLDEVADPAQRRAVAGLVATALNEWRESRVILTSRPKAWENEGRAALGSRVDEARICELDDAQIEEFVRHWYLAATTAARGDTAAARGHAESRAVDLIAAVKPERIRRLAATPLMLSILAMVHSRGVGLPQERSQLYHECIEFMLGYWDEIAAFSPDAELHEVAARDRQTKRQILEPVALWMHRLGSEQIEPLHDDLLKQFATGFASVLNEPRPAAERHARAFLRLIVERGGLMQESEAGQFRFVHLTFQEYLAASAIAHGEAPFGQVKAHLHNPWWREVILLAGGELSRQRSYRVKADTKAWLEGIRDAGTWAEAFLLRDIQLAAGCCAEMTATGTHTTLAHDLARRLIEAIMEAGPVIYNDVIPLPIRNLPAGHFAQSIADELPRAEARGNEFWQIPALLISRVLPNAVISKSLIQEFAAARISKDSYTSWWGNYFYLVHGPPSHRLSTLAEMRRLGTKDKELVLADEMIEKVISLNDQGLMEAIREWWRSEPECDSVASLESLRMLVLYGSKQDRTDSLSLLIEHLNNHETFFFSYLALRELGSTAATPNVRAAIEGLLTRPGFREFDKAAVLWETLFGHQGAKIDAELIKSSLLNEESKDWYAAAAFLLRHGDTKSRSEIRRRVSARMEGHDHDATLLMISLLLKNDSESNREALASRVNAIADLVEPSELTKVARYLGESAWRCPKVISALVHDLKECNLTAIVSLEILVELWRVRPVDITIVTPSISDLASRAISFAKYSEAWMDRGAAIRVIQALSTFSEFNCL